MSRLFVFLGGRWEPTLESGPIRSNDHCFVGDNLAIPPEFAHIHRPVPLSKNQCKCLAEQLVKHRDAVPASIRREMLDCFLNDYFSYTLKKLFSTISSIKKCVLEGSFSEIYLIAPKTSCDIAPMFGFQTTESKRGSANLLGAYIAGILPQAMPTVRMKRIYSVGDMLCNNKIRISMIALADKAFTFMLALKILTFRKRAFSGTVASVPVSLIVVRNAHQARFASRLLGKSIKSAVVLFPQLSQGGIADFRNTVRSLSAQAPTFSIGLLDIWRAYRRSRIEVKAIRRRERNVANGFLELDGLVISFDIDWLAQEIELVKVVTFYKQLLKCALQKSSASILVNFELVGRMAGVEASASRELGLPCYSIQTALVSSTPHPIFPHSEKFFADGQVTQQLIESIGIIRKGSVVYAGPPYNVAQVKSPDQFTRISFFTQPYEVDVTLDIVNSLALWARQNRAQVVLKLHPRDVLASYYQLLDNYADVIQVAHGRTNIEDLIAESDVAVTRTSSVAKEAIALGRPVIMCLWTAFDRSIEADYILWNETKRYCSSCRGELWDLLSAPDRTAAACKIVGSRIFGGKELTDLTSGITQHL